MIVMILYNKEDAKLILNNISILLKISSFIFLIPAFISLIYDEPLTFFYTYIFIALIMVFLSKLMYFKYNILGGLRHAIITTGIFWLVFNFFGALPFVFIEGVSFLDGFFESVSATTTTGLSIFYSQSSLAYSVVFFRSLIGWIGGLGIVILAILGVFLTYNRFKFLAEAEGRSDKIKSNIKKTIIYFWIIYLVLTILGIIGLRLSGLPLFDAINYAFTAISTTGTDINDFGLLGYGSLSAIIITFLLMLFGATSFVTHYLFLKKKDFKAYLKDREFLVMLLLIFFFFLISFIKFTKLIPFNMLYHITSALTCGGIALIPVYEMAKWPELYKALLVFLMFIGGSTASTAGGIKIQRFIVIIKMIWWKTKEILLPKNAYFAKTYNHKKLNDSELRDIYSFVQLYIMFVLLGAFILSFYGFGFVDSLFEVVSAQSNVGLSVGIASYALPAIPKIMLIINMLIGRLEIIPFFAIFGFLFNLTLKR